MLNRNTLPAMRRYCPYQQVQIVRISMQRNVSSSFACLLSTRRVLTMPKATCERVDVLSQSVRKATWYVCRYRKMRSNAPSMSRIFFLCVFGYLDFTRMLMRECGDDAVWEDSRKKICAEGAKRTKFLIQCNHTEKATPHHTKLITKF